MNPMMKVTGLILIGFIIGAALVMYIFLLGPIPIEGEFVIVCGKNEYKADAINFDGMSLIFYQDNNKRVLQLETCCPLIIIRGTTDVNVTWGDE